MTAKEEQEIRERIVIKPAERICELMNSAFACPFMPEGFVSANARIGKDDKPYISLHIGARDLSFNMDGDFLGQGTDLTSKWFKQVGKDDESLL